MTGTKTVAERLREYAKERKTETSPLNCSMAEHLKHKCSDYNDCGECEFASFKKIARQIEAEKAELAERIEVLKSDRDDYLEHVTTFACWQMQIANMLNIPLAEINNSEEVHSEIIAALKGANPSKSTGLPEGIEWPRFEDGELARIGDEFQHDGEAKEITRVLFYESRTWLRVKTEAYYRDYEYLPGKPLKRPEPEVLDADGVPIRVGDTVYALGEQNSWRGAMRVTSVGCEVIELEGDTYAAPCLLTHRKPDTQEDINTEAVRIANLVETDCFTEVLDLINALLERQRKLMGGE